MSVLFGFAVGSIGKASLSPKKDKSEILKMNNDSTMPAAHSDSMTAQEPETLDLHMVGYSDHRSYSESNTELVYRARNNHFTQDPTLSIPFYDSG